MEVVLLSECRVGEECRLVVGATERVLRAAEELFVRADGILLTIAPTLTPRALQSWMLSSK